MSLTQRQLNNKKVGKKNLNSIMTDENSQNFNLNSTKLGFINERKFSWNETQPTSEKKLFENSLKSPKNFSSQQIFVPKINLDSSQNLKLAFSQNLPKLNRLKTEYSQSGIEFKKIDSSMLTINTNDQMIEAQIERNIALQNNFQQLSIKVLDVLENIRNNDSDKVDSTMEELLVFLSSTCKTELELSKMINLSIKQSNKISQINLLNQKLNDKLSFFQEKFQLTNYKSDEIKEKYLKSIKELNLNKKVILNQKKIIEQLEQRLDFILSSDYLNEQQIPKSQNIRKVVTELVKENENLKRDNMKKDEELKRLTDIKLKLNQKLNLLSQKIEFLKSRVSIKEIDEIFLENSNLKISKNINNNYKENGSILQNDELPEKLDFRVNQLRNEYKSLVVDLLEHGSNIFLEQYNEMKDEKRKSEYVKLILSQYLLLNDFAERCNKISQLVHQLERIDNIDDLLNQTNIELKQIFKCKQAHVWLYDQLTGIFFTINENNIEERALNCKGLFSEIIKHQLASNKSENQDFVVYQQIVQETQLQNNAKKQGLQNEKLDNFIYSKTCLCIPLTFSGIKKQTIGILEITGSKSKVFSVDDEYCAVIISQFLNNQVARIREMRIKLMENRYKDFLQEAFLSLVQCLDKIQFTNCISTWLHKIFTITQFKFYFVQNETLKNDKNQEFSKQHGWAGHVLQVNQTMIVQNIKNTDNFDPLVDLYSILPIQIIPIQNNQQTVAIIEVPVKKCNRTSSVQDEFTFSSSPFMGLDSSFDNALKQFCTHIAIALSINKIY
ncbi:hypothetical protein TTHERM_00581780 (macronuclear) [Tetrahymena thermophila SB210]|uniref:GAF domain protein n=1 Tax=Tetrahymena thermophila (strain SB210) TaxID=312017 RepID=Q23QB0_TETTS|nr:hypothetical protein TTHERM_00581780 [Tetrahymena thermophila SB210]EAR98674.2 hypothetical protein TTHERM_00581780 [Tetrahymena thermophila SB210]|eukprot:XP_001018919.2 hypothetical protein TTHERM_00581780 [Tetrahymena thermophila SB210]